MLIMLLLLFAPIWLPVAVLFFYRLVVKGSILKTTQIRIRQCCWGLCLFVWVVWAVAVMVDG